MNLSIIVAASTNGAIGHNNQMLWHLPQDMRFFKNITWAMPVVMGRKTFESLGKPLQGRTNIVITRDSGWAHEGVETTPSLEQALEKAADLKTNEVFIIGGGQIYQQALPMANTVYLTRVHTTIEGADTFFSLPQTEEWEMVFAKDFDADEKHAFPYSFQTWKKKSRA